MADHDTVSVLIPVWNAAPWLSACMESIAAQTVQPDEVILVDDGSTDGSATICDDWAAQWPCVRVLHQPNKGVAAARNAALDAATGTLLLPVDADDWLEKDYLARLLALMAEYDVPIAACNHWIERESSRQPCFAGKQTLVLNAETALSQTLYHGVPDVSCWGKLYRREVFSGLRYPEGRLYEDTWLFAQVMLAAQRIAWTPEALYHYRIRSDSISRSVWSPEKMDYIDAVAQLTAAVRAAFPQLEAGCIRREAHALMSVRRYFVDCPDAMKPQRDAVEQTIVGYAKTVFGDRKAPLRDKLAMLALRLGPWAYDMLWKLQGKE